MKRINLIPPEFASGKKALVESGLLMQAVIGAVVLVVIMALIAIYSTISLNYGKQKKQAVDEKLSHISAQIEEAESTKQSSADQLKNIEDRIVVLRKKREQLARLDVTRTQWSQILSEFKQSLPDRAWADKLILETSKCQVFGGTYSNADVSKFIANLNESEYFSNATFVRTESNTVNKESVIFFEISFELKNI
ncbi:MAG: hypothetical protein A3G33_03550 [Omnitrophica bacterium RIFCSPLOWO2_12_FULL_44_17]|uniref:Fimbrial assembly protein n=1 Tax=Candidatus Danuiimicrobium aquiferis TaxID=1801832 RepID=A0A1G1KTZ8_9BACT|nr:MAG: hypothetical protein A3B72_07095 [Omnitrophica bacterium RIFCSPHIGHO2_02_FULL_45_28]OGW88724.1 MAG: hypothetical protein A3E74_05220 [Omnitrophica bacterium RIFCSPHIGHO2_12_FULL_44_12]OGW96390.1 MAG: hypothetical protein A3G33_03550 [Omnitrophica bacterium RIFCSPLOWO2_12_FULL_44_17]OGX04804.1 MAG: hypothetical protein A3J12_07580 [Omnitrophica bacterium RIFCSPLOWO2_02_FULL_44_11]